MGFYDGSNALPSHEQPRGGGFSRSYKDNARRGEYLPSSINAPDRPVRYGEGRRERPDLIPMDPEARGLGMPEPAAAPVQRQQRAPRVNARRAAHKPARIG